MSRYGPWGIVAAVVMVAFIVWLGAQMSRSDRANEVLLILVVCFAAAAVAFMAGWGIRRRRRR